MEKLAAHRRNLTSRPFPAFIAVTENQNGEQAIFLYDCEQERGILYMGDARWEHPYDMVDEKVPDLILNRPEQLWLSACWEASGALKAVREQIRAAAFR